MVIAMRLGPFTLHRLIGHGAMGEVWAATHDETTPVAIKVITHPQARLPTFRHIFLAEARALATLHHSNIVRIFDVGSTTVEEASSSQGRLLTDSPYLVMERIDCVPLSPHKNTLPWPSVRQLMLDVLLGLAHAHASGIVHCDLKPQNVLYDTAKQRTVLTDFGIARTFDRSPDQSLSTSVAGTPNYMAPEQLQGHWRQYGPWTDLYGFGCMAYALLSGQPPFAGRTALATMYAHIDEEPPPLHPQLPVPPGVEQWLTRLLAKRPEQRFQYAADAAWALQQLADPPEETSHPPNPGATEALFIDRREPTHSQSWEWMDTLEMPHPAFACGDNEDSNGGRPKETSPPLPSSWRSPPLPSSWRSLLSVRDRRPLSGTGLDLYELRQPPLIGRETERDQLWTLLQEVIQHRQARAVVITGTAGSGKSRLADWFCQQTHELGATHTLRAVHGPSASATHGLGGMLTRFFRLQKLSNEPLKEAVNQRLSHLVPPDPQLTQLLMTLVAPPTEADGPGLRFANVRERHLALHRLLSQLSRTRPVVLWLDDAPWSRDSVEFCLSTFDPDSPPLSVLFVLTARSNSPGNAPGAESLRTLFEQERVQHCPLSPLPKSDRPTFLRELLGLSSALAAEVDRRSDGNPLYAIQLVGDWVRQRLLRPGPDGFLFDGDRTNTGIPDSLHELWIQRITRWAASRPERDSHALELAALLGPIIDGDEWQQALHCAHIEGSPGLFSSLVEHGLLQLNHRERGGEWALTHGLLAESLIRRAREAERDKHHHRACADMLLSKDHPQHAERLGRHLLAAGAYSEALGPLLVSAEQALNTEDWSGFDDILRLRQQAIQVACPHAFSVAYGESLILRSRVAARRKQLHLLPPILDELQTVADTHDSRHFAAYAALGRCSLQFWTGELKQARKQAELALALAEQDKDRRASGRIRSIQTAILRFQGAYEEALTAAARGAADFASCEARQEQVQCQVLQATVLLQMGQYESAATTLNAALAASEKMGFRYGIGHAEAILGELRRHQQHFPAAITHYERSIANFREIGLDSTAPQCNLAALRLQQGQFERARETLNTLELRLQKKKMLQIFLPFCRLLLAVCAAYYEDWVLWKNYFSFSNKTLRAQPLLDRDTVFYLNLAGQIALEKGAFEQSRAALELAHFTASKMDRPDLLATVEAVLHRLAQAEDAAS